MSFEPNSSINVLSPTVDLPWAVGIVNRFEWDSVKWNTTKHDYAQDRPFNVTVFPAQEATRHENLIAHFTISGTNGSTGIKVPSNTHTGLYAFQFTYYVPENGNFGPQQVLFGPVRNLTIVSNSTSVEQYQGPTTPLLSAGGTPIEMDEDMALHSFGSSAALLTFSVASALTCVLLLPAIL